MSDSLQPHGLQYSRFPCPSLTPRACSNSCPSSHKCHPTISSSVILFSSHLQSFPESGSFLSSQFFASRGQSIGASASASVLPMNIQDWFPLGLTGLSPCNARDSQESSPTPQSKSINSLVLSFLCVDNATQMAEIKEELKSLLMRVKEESKRDNLGQYNKKTNTMASGPITAWKIEGGKLEIVTDFLSWAPKSLWMKTWNQKTIASWQESNEKPRQSVEKQRH